MALFGLLADPAAVLPSVSVTRSTSVVWDPIHGAIFYDVQVSGATPDENALVANLTKITSPSLPTSLFLSRLQFGTYHLRVRVGSIRTGLKETAGPGEWSDWLPVVFGNVPAPTNLRVV